MYLTLTFTQHSWILPQTVQFRHVPAETVPLSYQPSLRWRQLIRELCLAVEATSQPTWGGKQRGGQQKRLQMIQTSLDMLPFVLPTWTSTHWSNSSNRSQEPGKTNERIWLLTGKLSIFWILVIWSVTQSDNDWKAAVDVTNHSATELDIQYFNQWIDLFNRLWLQLQLSGIYDCYFRHLAILTVSYLTLLPWKCKYHRGKIECV